MNRVAPPPGDEPAVSKPAASTRDGLSIETKERIAQLVAEDAMDRFERPVVMWTGGKDSMLALSFLVGAADAGGMTRPPLVFIDHGTHFEETWQMLDRVGATWNLHAIVARNEDLLARFSEPGCVVQIDRLSPENQEEVRRTGYRKSRFPLNLGNVVANHLLKTVPMNRAILDHGFDAVVTGIRWDEDGARSVERFVTPRERPPHARVHPILHFSEAEVWATTFRRGLPVHPLYAKGFRSLDGRLDSRVLEPVPAWAQDLDATAERAGRAQDKEGIMERLRALGYM